ncbi:MAG: hypothetical protein K6T86_15430 [Pirellulales bacterium]|nr:hypothetical protein [Pirellulales bacterium]
MLAISAYVAVRVLVGWMLAWQERTTERYRAELSKAASRTAESGNAAKERTAR